MLVLDVGCKVPQETAHFSHMMLTIGTFSHASRSQHGLPSAIHTGGSLGLIFGTGFNLFSVLRFAFGTGFNLFIALRFAFGTCM